MSNDYNSFSTQKPAHLNYPLNPYEQYLLNTVLKTINTSSPNLKIILEYLENSLMRGVGQLSLYELCDSYAKLLISIALELNNGSTVKASRFLGVGRTTFLMMRQRLNFYRVTKRYKPAEQICPTCNQPVNKKEWHD